MSESPATRPHLNQPDGPDHPARLPQLEGRERAVRALADEARRLVGAVVTNTASRVFTEAITARLHELVDELVTHVPAELPSKHSRDLDREHSHPHDHFLFDPILGLYNPLALPVRVEWQPPRAIGHANFGPAYEGPPGCVHGGILSGVFDQVLNVANIKSGAAGPTARLTIDYRRPTPLGADLLFEGWVDEIDGRKVTSRGRVLADGTVTAEATGLFIVLGREAVERFRDRPA